MCFFHRHFALNKPPPETAPVSNSECRYGRRAVWYGDVRVCGGRTSDSYEAIPYESAISRECWSGDSQARLVPGTQLGSISGQRQAYNGHRLFGVAVLCFLISLLTR